MQEQVLLTKIYLYLCILSSNYQHVFQKLNSFFAEFPFLELISIGIGYQRWFCTLKRLVHQWLEPLKYCRTNLFLAYWDFWHKKFNWIASWLQCGVQYIMPQDVVYIIYLEKCRSTHYIIDVRRNKTGCIKFNLGWGNLCTKYIHCVPTHRQSSFKNCLWSTIHYGSTGCGVF